MDPIEKLTELFKKLPGVGPRQARRFVYALLSNTSSVRTELAHAITELDNHVVQCALCARFFKKTNESETKCSVCANAHTDTHTLLLVEKDVDFEAIYKSGSYLGRFFVLGGSIPILADDPTQHIRAKKLLSVVESQLSEGLNEVIIALSVNPEGDNTAQYVQKILEPLSQTHGFQITVLGRGLSTGTELEYTDSDTFASALQNRQ